MNLAAFLLDRTPDHCNYIIVADGPCVLEAACVNHAEEAGPPCTTFYIPGEDPHIPSLSWSVLLFMEHACVTLLVELEALKTCLPMIRFAMLDLPQPALQALTQWCAPWRSPVLPMVKIVRFITDIAASLS